MRYTIQYCLFTALLGVAMARIGLEKDLSMNVPFPGPVVRVDRNIPVGHMRPLGWQRQTDGPVSEENNGLSTIEFYNGYVSKDEPLVMRNALPETAPVFDHWQEDSYLVKQYSLVNVSVRVKTGKSQGKVMSSAQLMPMKKFLSEYKYEEWYMSTVLPENMMEEIPLPMCVRCGTISERLWSSQLWMSSGGTSSRVHSHDDHLLHCVMFGRRDFILIESHHRKAFDFVPDYAGSRAGHSDMNTERVDMFKYPGITRVPWTWATLMPGDCIFVPAGYIHQVRSYGRSISFTIEFSPLKAFDDTGCTLDDDEFAPLSDASFQWSFEEGRLSLKNKNLKSDDIRNIMISLVGKKNSLSFQRFDHFYKTLVDHSDDALDSRLVFDLITPKNGDKEIIESDLLSTPARKLTRMADIFNSIQKKAEKAKGKKKNRVEF